MNIFRAALLALIIPCLYAQTSVNGDRVFRGKVDLSLAKSFILPVVAEAPSGACIEEGAKVRLLLSINEYTCANGTWQLANGGGGGGGSATWGGITGTLSAQTDLQSALNGKEASISAGTTSQYWRGDKGWQDLPTAVRAALSAGTGINFSGGVFSLALPTTSTIGGVRALDCADEFIKQIGTDGIPVCAPASGGGTSLTAGDGLIIIDNEVMIDRAIEPERLFGFNDPLMAGEENQTYINKTPTNPDLWVYVSGAWKKAGGSGGGGGGYFLLATPSAGAGATATAYGHVMGTAGGTPLASSASARTTIMPFAGTIQGCRLLTSSAQPSNTLTITLMKNGADTGITYVHPADAAAGTYTIPNSVSIAIDDRLVWKFVNAAGATSAIISSIACQVI